MRKIAVLILCAGAALTMIGCPATEPVVVKQSASNSGAPAMSTGPTGGVVDSDLAKYQSEYDAAKSEFDKDPKDQTKEKSFVNATVKLGTATMLADSLAPKVKYPGALRLYREALKLDPGNEEALKNKKTIEDIYVSMGRPIPE